MIIVVGDSIIDKYIEGRALRISPEAPVPVLSDLKYSVKEGGAKNVFNNIQVQEKTFIKDPNYKEPVKTRVVASGQQIVRLDDEVKQSCQPYVPKDSFLVISDYNKGAITDYQSLIREAEISIIDTKRNFSTFHSADILKCNASEFRSYTNTEISEQSLSKLSNEQDSWIIVTDSDNGAFVFDYTGFYHVPTEPVEVVDVTGAGDVFLALLATEIYKGESIKRAVEVATRGATISVQHPGTYILSKEEYENCLY